MSKKKKLNSLEDLGGLVYSTGPASETWTDNEESAGEHIPSDQYLEAHLEKKGRGGKVAVLIKGFTGNDEELKELARKLKSHCATGGSVKDGDIIIQGNARDKTMDFLKSAGYNVKRVGG